MNTVQVVNAGLVQYYSFANPPNAPTVNSTTGAAFSAPIPKDGVFSTHQASVTGTGTVGATVLIQATNDPYTAGQDDIAARKWQNMNLGTTNTSTAVTSPQGYFRPDQTGNQVFAAGVPNGATFTYSTSTTGTLSSPATATATVPARFQANKWVLLGTITLTGTAEASDGMATLSSWKWTRADVTAVSGTGATVVCIQGN